MTLTRRQTLLAALAVAVAPGLSLAQDDPRVGERTMGSPDAPVTLVEYAMFTCPHCANFHKEVFPRIKEEYIDTGKVRLVYREVYFNRPSLWAAMIARCAPPERYFGIARETHHLGQLVVGRGSKRPDVAVGRHHQMPVVVGIQIQDDVGQTPSNQDEGLPVGSEGRLGRVAEDAGRRRIGGGTRQPAPRRPNRRRRRQDQA